MPIVTNFETLSELFHTVSQLYQRKNKTAFAFKPSPTAPYQTIDWDTFTEDVHALAAYYIENGIEKGDRVAILSENRYEWSVMDMALQLVAGVNASLYATLPANQCEYILKDSGSKLFLVSSQIQLKKALDVKANCPDLKQVIAFDKPAVAAMLSHDFVTMWSDVLAKGRDLTAKHMPEIKKRMKAQKPADLATLIYTSGTTGEPKGVMLTHSNVVSNVKAAHQVLNIDETDRSLSFLPLCHSFERTGGYYAMVAGGAEIYYAESVDTVSKNLGEARPTILISVPRLFEKIYNLVLKSVEEGTPTKKKIFKWALGVGNAYVAGKRGLTGVQMKVADKLVFSKLRARTGGRVKLFVSGGAALPADIGNFFAAAGMRITEGYGLTETSPVMTINPWGRQRYGTVGHVIPAVTVGIQRVSDNAIVAQLSGDDYPSSLSSEEGEILCKGPNVMQGYWGKPEDTQAVIDADGWFHTGDIGKFNDGYLMITDRLKHMIVNAGGKNIYPGPIEDMLKASLWIDQVVVIGEKQNYCSALVVPDLDMAKSYCKSNNISFNSDEDLVKVQGLIDAIDTDVKEVNKKLASHEKIRKFKLIATPFTVDNGLMTPTMKVKRKVVYAEFKSVIAEIYADDIP